jgi:hypothetical protein
MARLCAIALSLVVSGVAVAAKPATLQVVGDALHMAGLGASALPQPEDYSVVEGPSTAIRGFIAREGRTMIDGMLDSPLPGRGSLSFWFRTDQPYSSGTNAAAFKTELVSLPGTMRVALDANRSMFSIIVEWAGPRELVFDRHIRIQLPEFPPGWHHFAVSWNAGTGAANAFLNGSPFYEAGQNLSPWEIPEARRFNVPLERVPLARVVVSADELSQEVLNREIPANALHTLDHLLGQSPLPKLSDDRGPLIFENRLGAPSDLKGWPVEGPANIVFQDGWMRIRSERPDGPEGHVVLWCPKIFPDRFLAEWDFELLEPQGLSIVFFAAAGKEGRDLFSPQLAPRSGVFGQYTNGDIDCYHISYFASNPNVPRTVANFRKNAGFYLLSNGPVGIARTEATGAVHHAILRKAGARIQMAVNGRTIIDFEDDGRRAGPILGDGRIGLRQMQRTVQRYRNFRVFDLKAATAN